MQRGVSHKALAHRHLRQVHAIAKLHGDLDLQLLRRFVQQQDPERTVIHHAPRLLRDPRQQLVQIHERGHVAADFCKRFKRFRVQTLLFEQARVDQRQSHVRGKLAQDGRVALRIHVA